MHTSSPNERNIYPIHDRLLQRGEKERLLRQRGHTFWLTGLSGSGKSTIAQHLEARLHEAGFLSQVLDGDNIRAGLNNNLGFSDEDRIENIRRIAEVNKLFVGCGIVTISCFISPLSTERELAKQIIGAADFSEVFIAADLAACEERDVKGLYRKARTGAIQGFIGIHTPYEKPEHPDCLLDTAQMSIAEAVDQLYQFALPKVSLTSG